MAKSHLSLNENHTTSHKRAYSGNLRSYVSHANEDELYCAHDYVNPKKLKRFLVGEGLISHDEYPLSGGTNGSGYWIFSPDARRHRKIVKQFGDEWHVYLRNNPGNLKEDECGLVTEAYVLNSRGEPATPERFSPASMLKVTTKVQFKPGILENYTNRKFANEDESDYVSRVLTDIRSKLHGRAGEPVKIWTDFGRYFYDDIEGVKLRAADYGSYRWMQRNALPAIKTVLENSAAGEAILAIQESGKFKLTDGVEEDRMNLRKAFRHDIEEEYYMPAIEAAAKELGRDKKVVEVLRLM